jgi:polysulfide reductase chain C
MMNQSKGQNSWGWLVVLYVFLAGLGGGTFLFSFILLFIGKYEPVVQIGVLIGPLVVLLASVLLLFDLGSPGRAYRLFTTPATLMTSWMIRGAWILTAFIILGLAYALPAFNLFHWLPWEQTSGFGVGIGIVAAILAVIVPIYPGLLLGVIKSIPLWNTPALPPLFFLSGLDTGIAALVLASFGFPAAVGVEGFHLLGVIDIVLILILLIAIWAYVEIVRHAGVTASISISLLRTPLFIVGVAIAGLVLPLALLIISALVSDIQTIRVLDGIAGLLILTGALLLRLSIVTAGVRMIAR